MAAGPGLSRRDPDDRLHGALPEGAAGSFRRASPAPAAPAPLLVRALPSTALARRVGSPRGMRIAVVGNGRTVHALVRSSAVAALGHEVRLVTLGPVLPSSGIEVRTRPIPATVFQSVAAARTFLGDIRSFRPDLLHVHYAGGKLGTMASLSAVRPLVVTVMGGDVQP